MISIEPDGSVTFSVRIPSANSVELVGAFAGWSDERIPMERGDDGRWTARIDPGPGEHLFRYHVDGTRWVIDDEAHGISISDEASPRSRLWRPPGRIDPDSIAA